MGFFDNNSKRPNKTITVSGLSQPNGRLKVGRVHKKNPEEEPSETMVDNISVTDIKQIKRYLSTVNKTKETVLTFYCPISLAKIYCHSVLVDKLSDLTRFIILSLHRNHSVDEICSLTKMGDTTVKEELDYLTKGGIINNDSLTLTNLGKQYGVLLEAFASLSEGIDVAFNGFANEFETIDNSAYVVPDKDDYVLNNRYMPVLSRNDNYANSLDIAQSYIAPDIPFCKEIRNSLYTTVKINKDVSHYRRATLSCFDKGTKTDDGTSVKIAIPYDRITCKPLYKWIDPYRNVLSDVEIVNEKCPELITEKAKSIMRALSEEKSAETISRDVNTITGTMSQLEDDLIDSLPINDTAYVIARQNVQLTLREAVSHLLYLKETERKKLYAYRYFSYSVMEK